MDALDIVAPLPKAGESLIDHIRRIAGEERHAQANTHHPKSKRDTKRRDKGTPDSYGFAKRYPRRLIDY